MRVPLRTALLPLCLAACQQSAAPSVEATLSLHYPPGIVADLPHRSPGTIVQLQAQVLTERGRPVLGVEIIWDDGRLIPNLRPPRSLTDTAGIARTDWVLGPLAPDQFSIIREVRAYLPGAVNNPLQYRIEVIQCTRNC